jgi:alpha-L-rhamnosidase
MVRTVAGLELDPEQPGYRHVIFKPRPGGSITWAEARLETEIGVAGILWEKDGEALRVELTVPEGATGTFRPPDGFGEDRSFMGGRHVFSLEK